MRKKMSEKIIKDKLKLCYKFLKKMDKVEKKRYNKEGIGGIRMKKLFLLIFCFLMINISYAEAVNYIQSIDVISGNGTSTVIKTSAPIQYKVGKLTANQKLYFDFQDTILREKKSIPVGKNNIISVRAAQNMTKPSYVTRVVFDMTELTDYTAVLSEDKQTLTISIGSGEEIVKKKIVLDPGHGGSDPGAVVSDLSEKHLNLDIALRLQNLLEADGRFDVIMTRTSDVFVTLLERAEIANKNKADLFVCIHNNSMPTGFKGVMTLYNDTKLASNKELANIFQEILEKKLNMGSIGTRLRTDLVVLKNIEVPGILVEVACMTNLMERRALRTETFRQNAAQAIYDSIVTATL